MIVNKNGKVVANAAQPMIAFTNDANFMQWYTHLPNPTTDLSKFIVMKTYDNVSPTFIINGVEYKTVSTEAITSASTNQQIPTAKAVWNLVNSTLASLGAVVKNGMKVPARSLEFIPKDSFAHYSVTDDIPMVTAVETDNEVNCLTATDITEQGGEIWILFN